MRVLQVAWEYPPRLFGGLGRHVGGLTGALAGTGCAVTVLTPSCRGSEVAVPGVAVLRGHAPSVDLPQDRWLAGVLEANIAMAERAVSAGVTADVLHVHDWMAGHVARILGPVMGIPLVVTIHATERGRHMGHLAEAYSTWIDAQERALVARADAVVVCARHMQDHVVAHLDADRRRVHVIPNGVDVAAWQVPGMATGPLPRVVFAGRLEYEKGVQVLLAATDGLACEVVIAGDGSFGPKLRKMAGAGVRFVGHLPQPELAALLRSASAVVVPSLYEPFGLAALEGMAAGAPVVASAVDGLAEVLADGAGVLVEPDRPDALRRAIRQVLADPALAARLSREGAARAAQLTWHAAAGAHLELYRRLPIR